MQPLIRAAVFIAVAGTLFACSPKAEPEAEPEAVAETAPAPEADPAANDNMMEACVITMTEPEPIRVTTYWDAASRMNQSDSPSSARSVYWASAEEKASFTRGSSAGQLNIRCTSRSSPRISLSISAHTSTEQEVPLGAGEYPIVGNAQGALQPGQFLASSVLFDQYRIDPTGGTLTIDRFDMDGVRGSFRIEGTEAGANGGDVRLEGTFDIPCRGGPTEGACESSRSLSR
ncbi:MAG TPA: hypothetical protein VFS58_06350 [Steroidobacteraceae bacterium]|nr:hypothetical protein [Steroidobacteraceae bacterium]